MKGIIGTRFLIGAGAIAIGGVVGGTAALCLKISKTGVLPDSERDQQGYFLFRLGNKVFPYLKNKNPKISNIQKHEHMVSWLKEDSGLTDYPDENTGTNFRDICVNYLTSGGGSSKKKGRIKADYQAVKAEASRFCFLDKKKKQIIKHKSKKTETKTIESKGHLKSGEHITPKYEGFKDWGSSNLNLGRKFRILYPTESPVDKGDDGFETQTSSDKQGQTTIKNILSK